MTILVPTTSRRIPRTTGTDQVTEDLLAFQINAAAFFMEEDLLTELEQVECPNDFDRAFEDFFYQIPVEIREKVFPVPPEATGSTAGSGMVANPPPQVRGYGQKT